MGGKLGTSGEANTSSMTFEDWSETRRDLVAALDDSHGVDELTFAETSEKFRRHVDEYPQHHERYIGSLMTENLK